MHRALTLVFALCLVSPLSTQASAGLVIGYDIVQGDSLSAINGPGVTGLDLTRGGGATNADGGSDFASGNWDSNAYLQFGFSSTLPFDLTSLQFDLSANGTLDNFRVEYSLDNFATSGTAAGPFGVGLVNADLTTISDLSGVTAATFRIFSGAGVGDTVIINDLDPGPFSGNANIDFVLEGTAVPEPTSGLLVAVLGTGIALRRRRA